MNGGLLGGGSVSVSKVWGVEVKLHFIFLLLVGFILLQASDTAGMVLLLGVLFGSVLLHEFGHCGGARWVGGEADEIILWPLGGLTRMRIPKTAKAELISTAAGPAVNLVLALFGFVLLLGLLREGPGAVVTYVATGEHALANTMLFPFLRHLVWINAALFLFNVLPAYPMDGGRLFRATLWPLLGWRSATLVATGTAMAFGAAFAALGLFIQEFFLGLVGVLVIVSSYGEFQRAWVFKPLPRGWDDQMPWER